MEVVLRFAREHSDPDAAVADARAEIERTAFQLEFPDRIHDFETSLELASKDPGFMGVISASDAECEYQRFREERYALRSYFFYLEKHRNQDRFYLVCAVRAAKMSPLVTGVRTSNLTWKSVQDDLIFWCGHTPIPIDRRKCLVFGKDGKNESNGLH